MNNSSFTSNVVYMIISLVIMTVGILNAPEIQGIIMMAVAGCMYAIVAGIGFATMDYRGKPSRLGYRIARYFVATLLIVGFVAVIGNSFNDLSDTRTNTRILGSSGELLLIFYVLFYKPSQCTVGKKILKVVGMILLYLSLFGFVPLSKPVVVYSYYDGPHLETQYNFPALLFVAVIFIAGVIFLYYGHKGNISLKEDPQADYDTLKKEITLS